MKKRINSLILEGIFFCGSGLMLLLHSVQSIRGAFNRRLAESPYFFPLLMAVLMIVLSVWLIMEGIGKSRITEESHAASAAPEETSAGARGEDADAGVRRVLGVLLLCLLYYLALRFLHLPYITIGIFSLYFTISAFEVVTLVFLPAMMLFLGVRRPVILPAVSLGVTLFLSIAFRTCLHVLLP